MSNGAIGFSDVPVSFNLTFFSSEHGRVGQLVIRGDELAFEGNIAESARSFFEFLKEQVVDPYIKHKLKPETNAKEERAFAIDPSLVYEPLPGGFMLEGYLRADGQLVYVNEMDADDEGV